jgi:lysophospholipase L1-like esterase
MVKFFTIGLLSILLGVTAMRTWNHFWEGDEYIAKLARIEEGHYPAIIMGDSVIQTTNGDAEGQRQTVDQMLSEALGEQVVDLSRGGTPLNAHAYLLDLLAFKKVTADVLFLELNPIQSMRRQDPSAFLDWQKHLEMIRQDWNMAYRLFQYALYLDKKALGDCGKKPKVKATKLLFGKNFQVGQFRAELHRLVSQNQFDFPALVQLIQQAAKTCMQIAPKVVFFITPTDVMRLRMDSNRDVQNYRQKMVDTIAATCETLPITFINLYKALPDSRYFPDGGNGHFADGGYCHLSHEGRKFLVEQLVAAFKEN